MARIGTLVDIVDPHVHGRALPLAKYVLPHSALYCSHMLLMPNVPPLIDGKLTAEYNTGAAKIIAGYGCGLIPCMMLDDSTTPETINAFKLTLIITAIAVPVNTVFGIVCALAIVRKRFPGKGVLNAFIDLPLALSPVASASRCSSCTATTAGSAAGCPSMGSRCSSRCRRW